MENKKERVQNFKTAISSTIKSLSNLHNIEVSFGNQVSKSNQHSVKLPDLQTNDSTINYEEIRAIADSKSLRFRFSNNETLKKYVLEDYLEKIKLLKKYDKYYYSNNFKDLNINKKIYIHINTTNPILLPSSDERKIVEENGWQVSYDGMEINL